MPRKNASWSETCHVTNSSTTTCWLSAVCCCSARISWNRCRVSYFVTLCTGYGHLSFSPGSRTTSVSSALPNVVTTARSVKRTVYVNMNARIARTNSPASTQTRLFRTMFTTRCTPVASPTRQAAPEPSAGPAAPPPRSRRDRNRPARRRQPDCRSSQLTLARHVEHVDRRRPVLQVHADRHLRGDPRDQVQPRALHRLLQRVEVQAAPVQLRRRRVRRELPLV